MANEAYGVAPRNNTGRVGGWPGALFPWKDEFYKQAKALNPSLHVLDTDGCCWAETNPHKSDLQVLVDGAPICPAPYANGSCARGTNDFMAASFGITTPLVYPKMYSMQDNNVPCYGQVPLPLHRHSTIPYHHTILPAFCHWSLLNAPHRSGVCAHIHAHAARLTIPPSPFLEWLVCADVVATPCDPSQPLTVFQTWVRTTQAHRQPRDGQLWHLPRPCGPDCRPVIAKELLRSWRVCIVAHCIAVL